MLRCHAMTRISRILLLLSVAALLGATVASPAEAAKRKVPFGFFGAVVPPELSYPGAVSDAVLEEQMALMARSGVESVRITLAWDEVEAAPGAYDFANLDRLAAAAARHRLALILNVSVRSRLVTA